MCTWFGLVKECELNLRDSIISLWYLLDKNNLINHSNIITKYHNIFTTLTSLTLLNFSIDFYTLFFSQTSQETLLLFFPSLLFFLYWWCIPIAWEVATCSEIHWLITQTKSQVLGFIISKATFTCLIKVKSQWPCKRICHYIWAMAFIYFFFSYLKRHLTFLK